MSLQHHREFTNNFESLQQSIQALSSQGLFFTCDLLELFKLAAAEAKARTERLVRVVSFITTSQVVLVPRTTGALRTGCKTDIKQELFYAAF